MGQIKKNKFITSFRKFRLLLSIRENDMIKSKLKQQNVNKILRN